MSGNGLLVIREWCREDQKMVFKFSIHGQILILKKSKHRLMCENDDSHQYNIGIRTNIVRILIIFAL